MTGQTDLKETPELLCRVHFDKAADKAAPPEHGTWSTPHGVAPALDAAHPASHEKHLVSSNMSSSCRHPVVEAAGHVQARSVAGTGCRPLHALEIAPVSDSGPDIHPSLQLLGNTGRAAASCNSTSLLLLTVLWTTVGYSSVITVDSTQSPSWHLGLALSPHFHDCRLRSLRNRSRGSY